METSFAISAEDLVGASTSVGPTVNLRLAKTHTVHIFLKHEVVEAENLSAAVT